MKETLNKLIKNYLKTEITLEGADSQSLVTYVTPPEALWDGSELVVDHGQIAYVMIDGRITGPFYPGRHKLNVQNNPSLKNIIGTGCGTRFAPRCQFIYINQKNFMAIPFRIDSLIAVSDENHFEFSIKGTFSVAISDPKRFLNMGGFNECRPFDVSSLKALVESQLAPLIVKHVTFGLADYNIGGINTKLYEVSKNIKDDLRHVEPQMGLTVNNVTLQQVSVIKDEIFDEFRKFQELLRKLKALNISYAEYMRLEALKYGRPGPSQLYTRDRSDRYDRLI